MENICRICMNGSGELISMVKEINLNTYEILTIGEKFEECFGLKLEDIPTFTKICVQCKIQLTCFHKFKEQALKTHEKLFEISLEDDPAEDYPHRKDEDESDDAISVEYVDDKQESEIPHIDSQASFIEGTGETEELVQSIEHVSDLEDDHTESEESEFDETKFFEYLDSQTWRRKPPKHLKKKPSEKNFNFKCERCGRTFLEELVFNAHQNMHNGLPAYTCSICSKEYKRKAEYLYHMNNHNNIRNYKCETCEKSFISNGDLKLHLRFHNDIKPYVCDICGRQFKIKSHLTYHLETHTEENQNECPICHQMYKTKTTLKGHMETIHFKTKQYFCPICNKSFTRRYYLTVHSRTHKKKGGA